MRNKQDQQQIKLHKKLSLKQPVQFVLENKKQREFFRFIDGSIAEYDLTRYKGNEIRLTREEKDALCNFTGI